MTLSRSGQIASGKPLPTFNVEVEAVHPQIRSQMHCHIACRIASNSRGHNGAACESVYMCQGPLPVPGPSTAGKLEYIDASELQFNFCSFPQSDCRQDCHPPENPTGFFIRLVMHS